jgi:hypothetical protein
MRRPHKEKHTHGQIERKREEEDNVSVGSVKMTEVAYQWEGASAINKDDRNLTPDG